MPGKEIWFRGSDGAEFSCNEGTVVHGLMSKDGSFQEIAGPGAAAVATPGTTIEPDANAVPAPMKRPEIIARAKELGLVFKSNEKNAVLLEMIAAAEKAEDEDGE